MKIFRRFDKEECTKQTVVICSLAIMLLVVFVLSPNESYACTGFIADNDAVVLVGNNEDWPEPCSMVWFLPHEKGKYGRMYFGFSSGGPPFGGMNDQGLFFDKFGLARKPVQTSEQRKDGRADLILRIMETCATVEEALQVLKQYNLKFLERVQLMLADKTGDAAIIEDAEVIHRKQGKYQVVTNFRLSEIQPQDTIHWRYKKANSLLQKKPVSFESFRDILDAVHLEDRRWPTQYSNIYDLKNGVVYVYHFHDFQRKVVFNLYEELRKFLSAHRNCLDSSMPHIIYLGIAKFGRAYNFTKNGNYNPFAGSHIFYLYHNLRNMGMEKELVDSEIKNLLYGYFTSCAGILYILILLWSPDGEFLIMLVCDKKPLEGFSNCRVDIT